VRAVETLSTHFNKTSEHAERHTVQKSVLIITIQCSCEQDSYENLYLFVSNDKTYNSVTPENLITTLIFTHMLIGWSFSFRRRTAMKTLSWVDAKWHILWNANCYNKIWQDRILYPTT